MFGWKRATEHEPLGLVAADLLAEIEVAMALNPFRDDAEVKLMGERRDRLDDRAIAVGRVASSAV